MATLNPYIHFNGNCREAMNFYKEILGGELFFQTVGESPMAAQMPQFKDNILHAALSSGKIMIMASDGMGMEQKPGNNIEQCLVCESKEEIERLFNKLSAGGSVRMPLKEEFFGTFAMFTDKFGIQWMVQFNQAQK